MRRNVMNSSALVALVAIGLGAAACDTSGGSSATPAPSGENPLVDAKAVRAPLPPGTPEIPAIPSVRSFRKAGGSGWSLQKGARIVVSDSRRLRDEARLFAQELGGLPVVSGSRSSLRSGDVYLGLGRVGGGAGADPKTIQANNAPARSTADEAYTMDSRDGRLVITGATDAGVFYGTRTALQSLRARGYVPSGLVTDRPDRQQRGLLLDIARKHFTKDWIKSRVRELGNLKLNQIHLHISDDQGFRVQSRSHPEVVSKEHLSQQDVREIVKEASSRHITVIPEIDSPGHLGAVLRAHPDLQLKNASGTPARGAIDISKPAAAKIVDDLNLEFLQLFPGPYFHLGGDEYAALMAKNPEQSYPQLAALARRRFGAGATVQDAATGWLNDRAALVRKHGKQAKAWNDGFFSSPRVSADPDREVDFWAGRTNDKRLPEEYLRQRRKVVNMNSTFLYYVLGQPNGFRYPTGERIYREWSPSTLRGTQPVASQYAGPDTIVGGRLAVWCDNANAQTQDQVAQGIRMPLRALAQRLWNPQKPTQTWDSFTKLAGRVG